VEGKAMHIARAATIRIVVVRFFLRRFCMDTPRERYKVFFGKSSTDASYKQDQTNVNKFFIDQKKFPLVKTFPT
jgi:hypothetical protein